MAYTKTDWVDNTTLVSEALMDKIEQGIFDAHAGLPPAPVNGQWLTAAGGAMVWSALPASISPTIVDAKGDLIAATGADAVARLAVGTDGFALLADSSQAAGLVYSALQGRQAAVTVSAAGTDIAWGGGRAGRYSLVVTTGGGTLRRVGGPTNGNGVRLVVRNASVASITITHNAATGTGAPLLNSPMNTDLVLLANESVEYDYIDGNWYRVGAVQAAGGGTDWEGAWAAGTPYVKGDVVTYNGITYVAVNDSTGQTPPPAVGASTIGTSLPASPVDGQEFVLVDSVTAPTYQWRFKYIAAKASNKWIFIGGPPLFSEILTREQITNTAYADAPTVGPSVTVPVAGLYQLVFGAAWTNSVNNVGVRYIAPKLGAAATDDTDAALGRDQAGAFDGGLHRQIQRTIAASSLVKLQYKHTTATIEAERRYLSVVPVAVGG